jgi:L-aspartate oxidase
MRYVTSFDTENLTQHTTEVVVVGSGVAGLRAALELANDYTVTVLTKGEIRDSNTWWAQGGIAAVLREQDSVESHLEDTLEAGAGLCDRSAVETLVTEGPKQVKQLIEWGADFDREGDELAFTREGGHHEERVIHGRGDATGSLVEDTLVEQVRKNPRITVYENTTMVDLLTSGDRVNGLTFVEDGEFDVLWTRGLVLATGGLGQIFRETTNHGVVTGDGMAACLRAGHPLQDMEFIQFHPTTLYVAGGPRFLISEAVRGEGGLLRDENGERFMEDVHEMAELAPRDIVSRAILRRMIETDSTCVYLDVTHVDNSVIEERFPTIVDVCGQFDIDLSEDYIPVRPCAHYCMGGVEATIDGETGFDNLFCLGEAACTGVHGANRLASNSLLEGLVMGAKVVDSIRGELPSVNREPVSTEEFDRDLTIDHDDLRRSMKSTMWRNAGILRDGEKLEKADQRLADWLDLLSDYPASSREEVELINMMMIGRTVVRSALSRRESRGAHFREDYPDSDEERRRHSLIYADGTVRDKPLDTGSLTGEVDSSVT